LQKAGHSGEVEKIVINQRFIGLFVVWVNKEQFVRIILPEKIAA